MDHLQTLETCETQNPEDQLDFQVATLSTASISLSISSVIPKNFIFKPTKNVSPHFFKLRIPSQILCTSPLTMPSIALPKTLFKSSTTISSNPLQNPITFGPKKPSDPSSGAGLRRSSIMWFRNDLRVQDNECLNSANTESISVLPVYCFDPRDYGKSSSGFDKTGPYRASFILESVSDLRNRLQEKGSELVVRIGQPECVLVELAKEIGAEAVYAHREVSHGDVKAEEKMEAAMMEEGVEVKYCWGSTLYHIEDLPFNLDEMPSNYSGFKEKVKGLEVRKTIGALDKLRGLPRRGDVEAGDIPSLLDLGLIPNAAIPQEDGKLSVNASMSGGETEALQRLKKFADECRAQPQKAANGSAQRSIYGANFSCKISPWLAMGCLSPRCMVEELKKTLERSVSGKKDDGGETGTNWLMYELMWRDFFRFVTKKYSSGKKQLDESSVTSSYGAVFA